MRRKRINFASKLYRPDARLGSSLLKADEIMDKSLVMQNIVIIPGQKARLLTMRVCGRTGMTATDEATGITTRVQAKAAWLVANAAKRNEGDMNHGRGEGIECQSPSL